MTSIPIADLFGWGGTVTGTLLGIPQLVRLARTRNVEGLSLRAWQATLAINLGWTAHGIGIGQVPQVVTSALSLVATVPILFLLSRDLGRNPVLVFLPGLALAAVMIAIDRIFGSAAYGAFAVVPAVIANAGQTVALVRALHVRGVSPVFLLLAVLNQVFWLSWAILVHDAGTTIAAITTGSISIVNLGWYGARRAGVRSFGRGRRAVPILG